MSQTLVDLALGCRHWRSLVVLALLANLAAACGSSGIVVVDPVVPPIVEDDHLIVTLSDGDQARLRIRQEPGEETEKAECDADFYEQIGSLTFVEKMLEAQTFGSPAEEQAERDRLRQLIHDRRDALRQAFLDRLHRDSVGPDPTVVDCNLVLQPDDLIYARLRFAGPRSSNVAIGCLGDGDRRAQIRNPASTDLLSDKDTDPAMLEFRSSNCGIEPLTEGGSTFVDELGAVKSRCDPVRNVTITNCRIRGRTNAGAFGGDEWALSMIRADHVERLRESAPQHVVFSSVRMHGRYKGVFHMQPGIHHFTVQDSEVLGAFVGLTIHLPADGGWNIIRDSSITGQRKHVPGWKQLRKKWRGVNREVISIDSSEHNRIVNNHISDMEHEGIKLYRNCGERGSIRHRVPQYNQIINNLFDYSKGGDKNMVFLGSREDLKRWWGVKGYCHEDEGSNGERFAGNDVPEPWDTEVVRNSSESNRDWAQHNVIADNQAIGLASLADRPRIHLSSKAKVLGNFLIGNEFVADRTPDEGLEIQRARRAGCAVLAGVTHGMEGRPFPFVDEVRNGNLPYIRDGWTIKYFWDIRPQVQLSCGTPLTCRDNLLIRTTASCVEPVVLDFGADAQACNAPNNVCVEGSNAGDEHELACGSNLLGLQAACNLEFGRATDSQRDRTLLNRVRVFRPSDDTGDGRCTADETGISEGQRLVLPWLLERYEGSGARSNVVRYACKEHDRNGGDCQVNVRHYCEPLGPVE